MSTGSLVLGLCVVVLVWGVSIAGVYVHLRRRQLARAEMLGWLALTALLPGVGALAYIFSLAFQRLFPLPPGSAAAGARPNRFTQLRPPAAAAPRTGTIAASDLVKDTLFQRGPAQAAETAGVLVAAVEGPHAGQEFQVALLPAQVGRGDAAALRLDLDKGVSREHAELYRQDGALHIRDLGSQHGTSVNGVRIQDQALQIGDRIEIGLSALLIKRTGP